MAAASFLFVSLRAEPAHVALLGEASAAVKSGNYPMAVSKLEAARALRPDYPRIRVQLARSYTATNHPEAAIAQLQELASMGLAYAFAQDPAFTSLHAMAEFSAVLEKSAANLAPVGAIETEFTLPATDSIVEGLAYAEKSGAWYFSDVRNRCIWLRPAASHVLRKFSSDADNLPGVFGLKIDEAKHVLWASASAVPEMIGYTETDKGRAALVELELATGQVRHSYSVPTDGRAHVLGDLLLGADGSVFATDSASPTIWRLPPGGTQLEKWLEHGDFVSLQGLALAPGGDRLIVADYANGLWSIALSTRQVTLLSAPAHTTFFGIDGIYSAPGGLVAVQNGVNPQRLLRLDFGTDGQPTNVRVLASGHSTMTDLSLGQVANGHFHFTGDSGWSLYETPAAPPSSRPVAILTTAVD